MCKHQTSTSCTWLEVDDEDSFISDVGYAMAVIYENTVFTPIKQYLGGKAVKVKTSEIGKCLQNVVLCCDYDSGDG